MPSPSPKARRLPRIRLIRRGLKVLLFLAIAVWLGSCCIGVGVTLPAIGTVQHHVETGPDIIVVFTGIPVGGARGGDDWRILVQGYEPNLPRYWWFLPPRNAFSWSLPLWLSVPPIAIAWILARRFDVVRKGSICRSCGYNMQGLPDESRFCPECGAAIHAAPARARTLDAPRGGRSRQLARGAVWVATAMLVSAMLLSHGRAYVHRSAAWEQLGYIEWTEHRLDLAIITGSVAMTHDVRAKRDAGSWGYSVAEIDRWAGQFPWSGWRWPTFMWDSSGKWGWRIRIPLWFLLLALWTLPTWSLLRRYLRRPGRCVYCRFDLRPLPPRQAITCPYCFRTNFRVLKPGPASPTCPAPSRAG